MKILHLAKMTGIAGTENHLLALLPGLRARGLDARLIVLAEPNRPMDSYIEQMQARGIPAEQMPIARDLDYPLIGRLAARFRAERPDAVHTHLIHADWHGVIAARRAGIRRIYWTGHNDDPFRRRLHIRLPQIYLWRRITAGIAISESVRQFMIHIELAPPAKVQTIHYGYDLTGAGRGDPAARDRLRAELGMPPEALVAGSVCRLIEQKGLPHAIRAFKTIIEHHPHAHYIIVGDGPLREPLIALVNDLGLGGRVHLIGWRSDAAALMSAFDVFVMPSLWEGFGLVMLEAMAACLPIVASRVSALPEIAVAGETGYLVPPGDSGALAERIGGLFADPSLRARMGAAGRARLERDFSLGAMIDRTVDFYHRFA